MLGSMLLAGVILKVGLLFCSLFANGSLLFVCRVMVATLMINGADRKVVMAYSSVAHITLCGFLLGFMGFVVRLTHVVISPIMFLMIYISYGIRGSRIIAPSLTSRSVGLVLLSNLGFPMLGAFISEVYLVICLSGLHMAFFIIAFFGMGVVHMKMFHPLKGSVDIEVVIWVVVLLLLY